MGLVPTKLQIFLQSRKFLRFVVTRPAREGAVFTAPFEPPDAPHSQPASADDSAKYPIRNGAPRTPLAGCRKGGTTASLHALAIARHGHIGVRNLKEVVRNESKRRQCTQQRLYAGGAA